MSTMLVGLALFCIWLLLQVGHFWTLMRNILIETTGLLYVFYYNDTRHEFNCKLQWDSDLYIEPLVLCNISGKKLNELSDVSTVISRSDTSTIDYPARLSFQCCHWFCCNQVLLRNGQNSKSFENGRSYRCSNGIWTHNETTKHRPWFSTSAGIKRQFTWETSLLQPKEGFYRLYCNSTVELKLLATWADVNVLF